MTVRISINFLKKNSIFLSWTWRTDQKHNIKHFQDDGVVGFYLGSNRRVKMEQTLDQIRWYLVSFFSNSGDFYRPHHFLLSLHRTLIRPFIFSCPLTFGLRKTIDEETFLFFLFRLQSFSSMASERNVHRGFDLRSLLCSLLFQEDWSIRCLPALKV